MYIQCVVYRKQGIVLVNYYYISITSIRRLLSQSSRTYIHYKNLIWINNAQIHSVLP